MPNTYDTADIVRRVFVMNAEGLKFASYSVRDMATSKGRGEEVFSKLQHHLTYVPVSKLGETMLVNEIGATVYAVLDDDIARYLAEVITIVERHLEGGTYRDYTYFDTGFNGGSHSVIQVYRHPTTNDVQFQIWAGNGPILGIMTLTTAKLFCTLAAKARDGMKEAA